MCGQRLENEKTFDKSREWVFGCGTSPRVWKKILNQESCWFRKESLMPGATYRTGAFRLVEGTGEVSGSSSRTGHNSVSFICASVLKFSLSTDKHYKLA